MGKKRLGRAKQTASTMRAQRAYVRNPNFKRDFQDVQQHINWLVRSLRKKPHMKTQAFLETWKARLKEMIGRKEKNIGDNFLINNKPLMTIPEPKEMHDIYYALKNGEVLREFTLMEDNNALVNHTVVPLVSIRGTSRTLCMIKEEFRSG